MAKEKTKGRKAPAKHSPAMRQLAGDDPRRPRLHVTVSYPERLPPRPPPDSHEMQSVWTVGQMSILSTRKGHQQLASFLTSSS
jgi:hypothetical protein